MVKKKDEISGGKKISPKTKGKKFYEYFKIIKKGKKKTIKVEGFEKEKNPIKGQIKKENRILRNIFIALGIFILLILWAYFSFNSVKSFEYEGVDFKIVKFCDAKPCLILYQTSLPVIQNGNKADYNFYLRKDPRKLNVPFKGKIDLRENSNKNLVINITEELNCKGDAVIALGNILKFYKLLGTEFTRNDTLGCNPKGKYIFMNIQQGNETNIEQIAPSCYNINVNKCEVLEGTEKFLVESFVEANKFIKKQN